MVFTGGRGVHTPAEDSVAGSVIVWVAFDLAANLLPTVSTASNINKRSFAPLSWGNSSTYHLFCGARWNLNTCAMMRIVLEIFPRAGLSRNRKTFKAIKLHHGEKCRRSLSFIFQIPSLGMDSNQVRENTGRSFSKASKVAFI